MLSIIKFLSLTLFIAIGGYFLLGISLGEKTLYQHIDRIFHTEEALELKEELGKKVDNAALEIKEKATELAVDRIEKEIDNKKQKDEIKDKSPIEPPITKKDKQDNKADDRAALESLIKEKLKETL